MRKPANSSAWTATTAVNSLFDAGSITVALQFDNSADNITLVFTRLSTDNNEIRFFVKAFDATGTPEDVAGDYHLESQYLTCAKEQKLDALLMAREDEANSIAKTEKTEYFNCDDIEIFVETDKLIDYATSEGVLATDQFDNGLIVVTLDLTDASAPGGTRGALRLRQTQGQLL